MQYSALGAFEGGKRQKVRREPKSAPKQAPPEPLRATTRTDSVATAPAGGGAPAGTYPTTKEHAGSPGLLASQPKCRPG